MAFPAVRCSPKRLRSGSRDLAGPVPVDSEQHGTEHDAVIAVELMADSRYKLLGGPCRVVITPRRNRSPSPGQVLWVIVLESHGWPSEPVPNSAAGFMADASLLSRDNVADPVHR